MQKLNNHNKRTHKQTNKQTSESEQTEETSENLFWVTNKHKYAVSHFKFKTVFDEEKFV